MGINERTPAIGTIPRGKLNYYTHIRKDSVQTAERTLRNPYAYTKQIWKKARCFTPVTASTATVSRAMVRVR